MVSKGFMILVIFEILNLKESSNIRSYLREPLKTQIYQETNP